MEEKDEAGVFLRKKEKGRKIYVEKESMDRRAVDWIKETAKTPNFWIAIIVVAIVITLYLVFAQAKTCNNYSCFEEVMKSCEKASFINEGAEASWGYKIIGTSGSECNIEVSLLNAKQGALELEGLVGYKMNCFYPLGEASYPEKDLSKCHGRLKEEFQALTIAKLHTLIIEKLKQYSEQLESAGV